MPKALFKDCSPKKKYLFISLILLIAISIWLAPAGLKLLASYREERALMDLLRLSGAELQSVNVTGWARISGMGNMSLEGLAGSTADLLNLDGIGRTMENWENPYARGVKLEGTLPGGNEASIIAQTMELLQGEKITHLMISLEVEAGKAGYYKEKVRQTLVNRSADEYVALTYTGIINRALNQEELSARAEEVMAGAGAAVQEKTIKDNLVSLTGSSPSFPAGLSYREKEVNLNVALRSNFQEQATYVYLASPVIFMEY